jgi:macrolide transport system ATP-binding/permease protein
MDALGRFFRKLGILFRRERFGTELEEEMAFHREQTEQELIDGGMKPEEARFAAMRRFGNTTRLKEQSREATGFGAESVMQDFRFAIRQLRRNPGFATTAVLVLAMGICASVAIFAFVDAALIKPLPYKDPNRLVVLFETTTMGKQFHLSYLNYLDWKRSNTVFESIDVYSPFGFLLKTPTGLQRADGASVSAGFFHTLGVTPVLGRDFRSADDQPSAAHVVLLSYAAWQKQYGGRKEVLGQTVVLDGDPHTIVGVLPKSFSFAPAEPADFWAVVQSAGECAKIRGCHNLFGVARPKPRVSFEAAFANIQAIADQLAREYPDANRNRSAFMMTLTDVVVGDIRPILLALLCGAALLLLIATVNVASLLLVRSESRRREIAVRGALGASRARLLRQFVTEGLALVAISSVLGVAAACGAMQLLVRLIPADMMAKMPYLREAGINLHVVLFAVAVSLATGVIFSLTPGLRLSLSDLREGLTGGGRSFAGVAWRRFGANLVVIELATAVVLLVGAGLLGKSLYRLLHVDTGLEPDHLATLQVSAQRQQYSKDPQVVALERAIQEKLSSLPGVRSVAFTDGLPLGNGDGAKNYWIVGRPYNGEQNEMADREVSANYFSTLQAQLLRGRFFTEDEDTSKPLVAVINEQMAKRYFPGEDPVGKQIYEQGNAPQQRIEIVGVVNDIQEGQLDAAPAPAVYFPFNQHASTDFAVIVRTSQDEDSMLQSMTTAIHGIDPGLAVYDASTMEERIHDSPAAYLHRSSAYLVGGFAAVALLLGIVGLYGVTAYSVSQRTREIGVRMAMGAQRGAVYRLVLGEAGWLTVVGIGAGLVCSIAAATLIRKLLFGVSTWDVTTLAGVAFVLAVAALAASYLPARRAASVNPVEALRAE